MALKTLLCATALACAGQTLADETLTPHVPLVMWSSNPLFRGNNAYVGATLDASQVAQVLVTAANRDMVHDKWNILDHHEILFPTSEVLCVFLRNTLSTSDLSSLAKESSATSFVQSAVNDAKSSVVLPHTIRAEALTAALPSEDVYKTSAADLEKFLTSSEAKEILSNDKTELLVVEVPATLEANELDNAIKAASEALNKATNGRVDFVLTGDSAHNVHVATRRLQSAADGANADAAAACAAGYLLGVKNGKAFCFSHYVHMTPELMTGVFLGIFFVFLAYIGLGALNAIQTPTRYPLHGPPKGKEF